MEPPARRLKYLEEYKKKNAKRLKARSRKYYLGKKLVGDRWPDWIRIKTTLLSVISFWSRVKITSRDKCWEWTGSRFKPTSNMLEYGKSRGTVAHRIAWQLANGPIPAGMMVLHECDNPPCCNPSHLFLGTASDNMRDCARKGRAGGKPRYGEDNPVSILTERQVIEILSMKPPYEPLPVTGQRYGVHGGTIWAVRHRKIWKHVTPP